MAHGYPNQTTPVSAASAVVSAASAVATIPAVAGKCAYVTGFEITAGGATAAALAEAVLSGIRGGSATYIFGAPAGATLQATPLIVRFEPALPASEINTAIAITLPTLGTGNTKAAVAIHGFYTEG